MSDTPDQPQPLPSTRFAALIEELSASFPKAKFEPTDNPSNLASQISRYVPEPERTRWYNYLLKDALPAKEADSFWHKLIANLGYLVLGAAALAVMGGIIAGLLLPQLGFRTAMGNPEIARGVITFLFAFGTISIALLIAAASFWANASTLEARFRFAKDILMVLIGILGTIIGFYFGTTDNPPPQDQPEIAQPANP